MPAKIILTSLKRSEHHAKANPGAQIITMTMKPQPGIPNLDFLAPTKAMVYGHKGYEGWPRLSDEGYKIEYRKIIMRNMPSINTWYRTLTSDIILCCYCRPGVFCHRTFVGETFEWLNGKGIGNHEIVRD